MPIQRRSVTPVTIPNLKVEETFDHGAHVLEPGTEFHVQGLQGRFVFVSHTTNTATGEEWLNAHGPIGQKAKARAFATDRITVVHKDRKRED